LQTETYSYSMVASTWLGIASVVRLCFLSSFFARVQAKWLDLQKCRQGGEVDGQGKQRTRHDLFSRGPRCGLGAPFWG